MNLQPIWDHSQAWGMDFWVLMAIARSAEDDGTVTMSVRQIADGARVSPSATLPRQPRSLGELAVTSNRTTTSPQRTG